MALVEKKRHVTFNDLRTLLNLNLQVKLGNEVSAYTKIKIPFMPLCYAFCSETGSELMF